MVLKNSNLAIVGDELKDAKIIKGIYLILSRQLIEENFTKLRNSFSFYVNLPQVFKPYGGSVAGRSTCRNRNPAVPVSSPTLTWTCLTVAPSSNPWLSLKIANWFAFGQLGFLTMLSSV